MKERKIIQISVASGGDDGADILYALCEDGTLWSLFGANEKGKGGNDWVPIIPPREA